MHKVMHKGDFSGIYALFSFVFLNLKVSNKKFRFRLAGLVFLYIVAIVFQLLAFLVFFQGLKYYLSSELMPELVHTIVQSLNLTSVELLMLLIAPSFVLMLLSSKILNISRVGLSRLALDLKSGFERYFYNRVKVEKLYQSSAFDKYVEASFGTVRALFLNSFVFVQAVSALIVLFYFDYLVGLLCLVSFFIFMFAINQFAEKKVINKEAETAESVDDCLNEELGLSSKSFERLERMRLFSRNYGAYVIFFVAVSGIVFSLKFMSELGTFTAVILLVRYYGQIFTPFAVISAALFPYKKTITTLVNISKIMDRYDELDVPDSEARIKFSLLVSRGYAKRQELIDEDKSLFSELAEHYKKDVHVATTKFEDGHLLSRSDIHVLMNKIKGGESGKVKSSDLLFCL